MCMMVYVAADSPLPTSEWDKTHPGFHVGVVSGRNQRVRHQFSKPFVYRVGSHKGCGCGFDWDGFDGVDEADPEFADAHESRRRLAEFLAEGLRFQPDLELYACWNGDEASEPETRGRIAPADLIGGHTSFGEKEWLLVVDPTDRENPSETRFEPPPD